MVLHAGQDTVIYHRDVIGVFDLENTSVSQITRGFLAGATQRGEVVDVTEEMPKSFIVCTPPEGGRASVYISQISTSTLLKRSKPGRKKGF